MSSNNNASAAAAAANNNNKKRGVDALLQRLGRDLPSGGRVRIRLVKGPDGTVSSDPVDAKAPKEAFPLVAKFPESVVKPDFAAPSSKHATARFYQQDVPKPLDDSDDEADNAANEPSKKKRWRYQKDVPKRQWVLQEQVEFLETMVARREHRTSSLDPRRISERYEGQPEYNSSNYVLFLVQPQPQQRQGNDVGDDDEQHQQPQIQLINLPSANCTVTFAQPSARKTYSLSEAEQVIQDQRMGLVRTMHHVVDGREDGGATTAATAANGGGGDGGGGGGGEQQQQQQKVLRIPPRKNKNTSKSRLLDRLKSKAKALAAGGDEDDDEADDVMGDVTFRNRKGGGGAGGGGAARKELLSTLGDGVAVSQDGVLGGSDDAVFGGRQRFGQFQADARNGSSAAGGVDDDEDAKAGPAAENNERGADGAAMSDDFYQRDVQAEYEELDYDAQEQFDDDDVDLGEGEVAADGGGYAAEDVDEDDYEELDADEEAVGGAEGLASVAGFKAMLAKARGEITPGQEGGGPDAPAAAGGGGAANGDKKGDAAAGGAAGAAAAASKQAATAAGGKQEKAPEKDHMAKILAAAEEARMKAGQPAAAGPSEGTAAGAAAGAGAAAAAPPPIQADAVIQVDENGLRLITLDAVRKEIWLNHGSIPMKRLMKIFDVKKKYAARQNTFKEVVKELCTIKNDPIAGRVLVLKQHYANM